MNILKAIYNFFFGRTINGKQWVEESMTEKYGEDWLEQCLNSLKDKDIRENLKNTLNL